ncbi:hypothetical protein B0H14DRAFT_3693250 [Mycena olivaceomarginata]|nr:hypothetical protein B0H14DRAFT_3693250 [Mycena olivaceomarginata]
MTGGVGSSLAAAPADARRSGTAASSAPLGTPPDSHTLTVGLRALLAVGARVNFERAERCPQYHRSTTSERQDANARAPMTKATYRQGASPVSSRYTVCPPLFPNSSLMPATPVSPVSPSPILLVPPWMWTFDVVLSSPPSYTAKNGVPLLFVPRSSLTSNDLTPTSDIRIP